MAQILSYSSLWSVRSESSQYWIWQLVMSKLHEGMSFQFWHQIVASKNFEKLNFHIILLFCTFWYIIQLINTVDYFVDQMMTFLFSNVFNHYRIQFGVSPNLLYILKATIIFKKCENVIFFERIFFFQESLDSPIFIFK